METSGLYTSRRDDKDILLEYKSIDLRALPMKRGELLGIPIDNITRDEAVAAILDLVEKKKGPHHVLFLDPLKLMRIRGPKNRYIGAQARLILADGAGLQWAAEKLGMPLVERVPMMALLMDVIRLAEKTEQTIYLLGSKPDYLERVFFNLQRSFPEIRIIGRQSGHFDARRETLVKESLRKSSPDLIFLGMGFLAQEAWIRDNAEFLGKAVVIGVDGTFDVLSGLEKKSPDWFTLRGLTWLWRTMSRPWYLDRMFLIFKFYVLVLWKAFRQRKK